MLHARRRTPRGYLSAQSLRSADQEALGGPREGGSKTAGAAINARVAGRSDTSACASGTGSDSALGKTAADADPEQNAQCEEPCLGAYGRGNAGPEFGSAVALRFAEQRSSNRGSGVADAYAASGANRCTVNVTSTTPTRKRDLIALALYREFLVLRCPHGPLDGQYVAHPQKKYGPW
jgi:hypothetical protein